MNEALSGVVALSLAAGCGAAQPPASTATTDAALESRISDLEAEVTGLQYRLSQFETVALIPVAGDAAYSVVQTAQGPLFFVVDDVRAQGDGQAIQMRIGNPTSAMLSGLKFNVTWGPSFGATRAEDAPPLPALSERRRDVQIAQELRPGSWTVVRFSVGPIRSEDFGSLVLRDVTLEQVSLRNPG